jgi:hypothetical protein
MGCEYMDWVSGDMVTLKTDKRLTAAQRKRIAEIVEPEHGMGRILDSIFVSDNGCLGLPTGWASVSFVGGYLMGISPEGRAHS